MHCFCSDMREVPGLRRQFAPEARAPQSKTLPLKWLLKRGFWKVWGGIVWKMLGKKKPVIQDLRLLVCCENPVQRFELLQRLAETDAPTVLAEAVDQQFQRCHDLSLRNQDQQ